jgi:transglutaminase-like putative cysteine protease
MNHHRTASMLYTLVLVAGALACTLPVEIVFETPTSEARPSPTFLPLPTPAGSHAASPTSMPAGSPGPTATDPALATPSDGLAGPIILSLTEYRVTHRVTLTNAGPGAAKPLKLWVALIRTLEPYQEVLASVIEPSDYEVVEDEYGNQYAQFEFSDVAAGQSVQASLTYHVQVRELSYELSGCRGETPEAFLEAETYVEVGDPTVRDLAAQLTQGQANACQILETLYDYVGDNITYSSYEASDHGAVWALDHGSGDCTEFTDVLLALSRAAGFPARFLEGVTYREGRGSEPGQIKHDWLEAYLPGIGWVPLDPTWGRFRDRRDKYFAHMSPDHIVVTVGRNPSMLRGYHYFYYNWSGKDVDVSHDATWEVTPED